MHPLDLPLDLPLNSVPHHSVSLHSNFVPRVSPLPAPWSKGRGRGQEEKRPLEPGVLLPSSIYTGMCCPTGSCFWDSDLEQGIILKLFSTTGCNIANAKK